jgi:hypothetical protein
LSSLRALALSIFAFLVVPAAAHAQSSGGVEYTPPPPVDMTAPGASAQLLPDGTAAAPAGAPEPVKQAIWAANRLLDKPYKYGGGHAKVEDNGYDCSGTVSYALIHAGLLKSPLPSGPLMSWGARGRGRWITVYAHGGHAYMTIAGLRFDTSGRGEDGPRWRLEPRSGAGFVKRHPAGL